MENNPNSPLDDFERKQEFGDGKPANGEGHAPNFKNAQNPPGTPADRGDSEKPSNLGLESFLNELRAALGTNTSNYNNHRPTADSRTAGGGSGKDFGGNSGNGGNGGGFGGFGGGFGGNNGNGGNGGNGGDSGQNKKPNFFSFQKRPAKPRITPFNITVAVIMLIVGIVALMSRIWTDVLWFSQLGFVSVYWIDWAGILGTGLACAILVAVCTAVTMQIAIRAGKKPDAKPPTQGVIGKQREQFEAFQKLLIVGIPVLLGIFVGSNTSQIWKVFALAINRRDFGYKDPQFHLDAGFYVFTLPALEQLLQLVGVIIGLCLIVAVFVYLFTGGIQLIKGKRNKTAGIFTKAARMHLCGLAALGSLWMAARYWLSTYAMLLGNNSKFSGAGYTNVHVDIPARYILAGISLVVALLFVITMFRPGRHLPVIGVAFTVISALVVGGVYPAIIQKFQVEPNAITMEAPYIQRNIDATLHAYGLENVEKTTYAAKTQATRGQIREDSESTASVRILDPNIVSPSFNQLQQNRQYYSFTRSLAVDRYLIDGKRHDTVIAVREINLGGLGAAQRTWVNDHTVYTHGFGVVAAYGNTAQGDGRPGFWEQGIPSTGALGAYEPRVYFGQHSPEYSIVGGSKTSKPMEIDYPDDKAPNGQVNTTYQGNGGPSIGNLWNRLLYAVKFGSSEIIFTDRVNEKSQILYDRDPRLRVQKVAPYLTLDQRAYPAVVDMDGNPDTPKRLVWVVDGYTTSDNFPYSAHEELEKATEDSRQGSMQVNDENARINYLRNSVKAVVDAYSGQVTLYKWGKSTPILDAWNKIYGSKVKPTSDIPSDLLSHLRYPEDLFKVQRTLLARYHVTDAASFYSGGDFWKLPDDPTKRDVSARNGDPAEDVPGVNEPQPPYYLTLQMPGQKQASFSLTSTYIPGGNTDRNVLTGFLAVDAEAAGADGKVNPNYGKMRIIELPRDLTVPGPGQVQNNFDSSPTVSTQLNLLRTGGSRILFGNQLTLPVGGGLLYVEPVYIQSTGGTSYPLLRYVLTSFGDSIGFAPTLDESIDQLFGGDSGARAGDAGVKVTGSTSASENPGNATASENPGATAGGAANSPTGNTGSASSAGSAGSATGNAIMPPTSSSGGNLPGKGMATGGTPKEQLSAALAEAKQAMADAKAALAAGDWARYGTAQQQLQTALEKAVAADQKLRGQG